MLPTLSQGQPWNSVPVSWRSECSWNFLCLLGKLRLTPASDLPAPGTDCIFHLPLVHSVTASQMYFDANIAQSLIKNYGKTLSCHKANKACYPSCHRGRLTDAVCSPPGPCINLASTHYKEESRPRDDQYCIISPTRVAPAVANALSFLCHAGGGPGKEGRGAI